MHYVYELINLLGTVEYVGQTTNPKRRFYQHIKFKPKNNNRHGKFYGRQDISMHIVAICSTKSEALQIEYNLQKFWGLQTDKDKCKSVKPKGSKHWNSKLTEQQVKEIKSLLSQKISCAEIGRKFNIPKRNIGHIKSGKNWSHIS